MLNKAIRFLKWLKDAGETWKRQIGDAKQLVFNGTEFDIVDADSHDDKVDAEHPRHRDNFNDYVETNRYDYESKEVRSDVLSGKTEKQILRQATNNHHVMGDLLQDPSLVNAETETEAVAKVAAENPGWAKMSDAVDAYDIDLEAGDTAEADTGDVDTDGMTQVEVDTDTGSVTEAGNSIDTGNSVSSGNSVDTDLGGNTL